MTTAQTTSAEPTPVPQRDRDRSARLWLQSIDPNLTSEQRRLINEQIDDPLVLLAAVGYNTAYVFLQSECAAYDLSQGRQTSAEERITRLRADAEMAVQCHIDLLRLLYETDHHGGPAGADLFPEMKKASRQLLAMAQNAAAKVGQVLDLTGMELRSQRTLPDPKELTNALDPPDPPG